MLVRKIYSGNKRSVDFGPVTPPANLEKFKHDVTHRCPSADVFNEQAIPDIRVLGVFPAHFVEYASLSQWQFIDNQPLWNGTANKLKQSARPVTGFASRPHMWRMRDQDGKEFYAYCTEPDASRVCNEASHLSQLFYMHSKRCQISAWHHDHSDVLFVQQALQESQLVTHLKDFPILILGHTNLVDVEMQKIRHQKRVVSLPPCFELSIWEDPGSSPIMALTVKFQYGGIIGTELTKQLAKYLSGLTIASKIAQDISSGFTGCVFPGLFATVCPSEKIPGDFTTIKPLLPGRVTRFGLMSPSTTLPNERLIEHGKRIGLTARNTEIAHLVKGAASLRTIVLGFSQIDASSNIVLFNVLREIAHLGRSDVPLNRFPKQKACIPVDNIYSGEVLPLQLKVVSPTTHCMGDYLPRYVRMKTPAVEDLQGLPLMVVGVAEEDITHYAQRQNWKLSEKPVWNGTSVFEEFHYQTYLPQKVGNKKRPLMFKALDTQSGKYFMLLAVIPSKEYVHHYALMMKQVTDDVEVRYHHQSGKHYARKALQESRLLTELNSHTEWQSREAVLVMGYQTLTAQYLTAAGFKCALDTSQQYSFNQVSNDFSYTIMTKPGYRPVVIVCVEFCYWGELSMHLANELLKSGSLYGLLHIAKAGQTAGLHSLNQIYMPRSFTIMDADEAIHSVALQRHLFSDNEELAVSLTGDHLSVDSTVLETYDSIVKAVAHNSCATIDIEGARFAEAARKRNVRYGALYFASDHVPCEAKPHNNNASVSLISDSATVASHKEDIMQEAVHHRLVPALRK